MTTGKPKYKILVADDNRDLVQSLTIRLREQGFEVIPAMDSYQALQFASQVKPDLLLLDINMPAGDGFSVQERIAKMPECTSTPVIYFTGDRSDRVRIGAKKHRAAALLLKPFDLDTLLNAIDGALSKRNEESKPAAEAVQKQAA